MKSIFFTFVFLACFSLKAQIINFPDSNFKNKLLQANTTNGTAFDDNIQPIVIDINGNGEIEVSEALLVYRLQVPLASISDLTGVEYFTNMQYLAVQLNSISNLNIVALTQLKSLRCDLNNLSSIDLTGLTALEIINIAHNQIQEIDCTNKPLLARVLCEYNQITTLDFSNNPLLYRLKCSNNNLTSINIKNGINQDFSNSGFNDCWKTNNPNLATVCVDDSELASVQSYLNGCSTQAVTITSNCGLGNEEFVTAKTVLFPNPATNNVNINCNCNIKMVELLDIQGRLLATKKGNNNQIILDISSYTNGVYFVKITTDKGVRTEKVIKE